MPAQSPSEEMQDLSLPIRLADGSMATVRRLSPDRIYMEVDAACMLRAPLMFEMRVPQTRMVFLAEARVVSISKLGAVSGIELRLSNLRLLARP